ncbi:hypothetical protein [Xanthobacter sediminis]|uniref:hypothetical protein n=1 Tax=Xanthobacter sediminis TaxID=3119926 RepID=UPI003729BD98
MSLPPEKTARLAAALKANLARRKAQTRARRDAEAEGADAPGPDGAPARESGIASEPGAAAIVPGGKAR